MLVYSHTSETSNIDIITHHFIDDVNNIRSICVNKDIDKDQALILLNEIPIVDPIE
jgi:hypothetical protein